MNLNFTSIINKSRKIIPGGVCSNTRYDPNDIFVARANGAYFWDQNGKRYIDYSCAGGTVILGYNNQTVKKKIKEAVNTQLIYGIGATEPEVVLAEKLNKHVKGIEKAHLCNGCTDAVFHSIRLARGITKRDKIVKLEGAYHGWHDYVLGNANLRDETIKQNRVYSKGILNVATDNTIVCRINDLDHFKEACEKNKGRIAAVICDLCNTALGCIKLKEDYVRGLREICDEEGILLIFDETVSGFRAGLGGAQEEYNVLPDLVTIGGVMSNGYPVAAVGGKAKYMDRFNTAGGDVSTQNTYYGNPVMASVGIAVIEELEKPGVYERLSSLSEQFLKGMQKISVELGLEFSGQYMGGLVGFCFANDPVSCYGDSDSQNEIYMAKFREGMLNGGVFLPKGPYRAIMLSQAHTGDDISETLSIAFDVLKNIKGGTEQ